MGSRTDNYQIGLSVTPANNFTLVSDGAGSMKLARGNPGSTTQDIMTVNAAGRVGLLAQPLVTAAAVPSFRARKSATQLITFNTDVLITWDTLDWNDGGAFFSNGFNPQVAGLYQFCWRARSSPVSGTMSDYAASLQINGGQNISGSNILVAGMNVALSTGSAIVKMNGSSDYVNLVVYQANSANANATVSNVASVTSWEGCLIKAL